MTEVQVLDRAEALARREQLVAELVERYGTDDRFALRELSWSDAMQDDDAKKLDELRTLDFLLDG